MNRYFRPRIIAPASLALGAAAALAIPARAQAPQPPADPRAANLAEIERSKALISEFYELQRQIDTAEARASLEKQLLENRLELLQIEIDSLTGSIDERQEEITKADEDRLELVEKHDALEAAMGRQLDAVEELERRIRALLPALPAPLAETVKELATRMPEEGKGRDDIKASPSSRFAAALAILDQVSRFDSDITVVPEIREFEDGRKLNVQTLYLGLAQAFYAGSGDSADIAGTGIPTPSGWVWTERPDDAETIGRAIRQYSKEEPASFVPLPVEITDLSAK